MTKRKQSGGGPTAAIGGMLAGFDHQIFRTTPPPHELVLKARPVRGLSGEGGDLEITFPDDEVLEVVVEREAAEPAAAWEGSAPAQTWEPAEAPTILEGSSSDPE